MEVLNDSMENVSGSYVSKSEMQKVSCVSISVDCVCVFVNGGGGVVFNLCDFVFRVERDAAGKQSIYVQNRS